MKESSVKLLNEMKQYFQQVIPTYEKYAGDQTENARIINNYKIMISNIDKIIEDEKSDDTPNSTRLFEKLRKIQNNQILLEDLIGDTTDKVGSVLDELYKSGVTPGKGDALRSDIIREEYHSNVFHGYSESLVTDYLASYVCIANPTENEELDKIISSFKKVFEGVEHNTCIDYTQILDRLQEVELPNETKIRVVLDDWYEGESIRIETKIDDKWNEVVDFVICAHQSLISKTCARKVARLLEADYTEKDTIL